MPTTTSPISVPSLTDLVSMLERCATICTDGEKRYTEAAYETRDLALRELFLEYAKQRADFVIALRSAIGELGAMSAHHGTATGAMHRGFMAFRSAVERHDPEAIFAECERGERGALARYDKVLARFPLDTLSPEIRTMLTSQRAAIKVAHDDMLRRMAQPH